MQVPVIESKENILDQNLSFNIYLLKFIKYRTTKWNGQLVLLNLILKKGLFNQMSYGGYYM